ncbi:MAG: hypothetical protein WCL06_06935, partial [Bacteroidota bacterium]
FSANKTHILYQWGKFFTTEFDLAGNPYLRCDINRSENVLKGFYVITKAGYLQNDMDFGSIAPDKILLNDMDCKDGTFLITGNDPFFCLTSDYFTGQVQWLLLLHKHLYLLLSLLAMVLILVFDGIRLRFRKEKNS